MLFNIFCILASVDIALVHARPSSTPADVFTRSQQCPGDQEYVGWDSTCKCDKNLTLDQTMNKCRYETLAKPQCANGEKPYCGIGVANYTEFDEKNDLCGNNGLNQAFCSTETNLFATLSPPVNTTSDGAAGSAVSAKFALAGSKCFFWGCAPKCGYWKAWLNGGCGYTPIPCPVCVVPAVPYCARNPATSCPYGECMDLTV